uniref:RNA polymerase alpha subunit n=1 Tax=Halosiphon tomentosus TaxID=64927 RepID=UPI002E78C5FC|nr:RNA polymerase alpha subunit [Halosiphon tomentosus]WAM63697.1 RNA polymerase alpha subunit [Halosiphon tomentosus]
MKINSKCKCLALDLLNPNEFYGHFVFTSLEKGEGTTIGNMLRRAMLSNLYGYRIVGVRIAGINNEFAPLEGVREDLLEIILNLKEIIIINQDMIGRNSCALVKVQGPAIVTAGSLLLPKGFKVLNPNNHLLTIYDDSLIQLEFKIEYGKSYVLAKDQKLEGAVNFIPVDSNFAPVLKVNWHIKPMPQDVENTNEELHLEIFTNGTLLPHQALLQARNVIGYMLSTLNNIEFPCFNIKDKNDETHVEKSLEDNKKILETKGLNYKPNSNQIKAKSTEKEKDITLQTKAKPIEKERDITLQMKAKLTKKKPNKQSTPEERLLKRVADMESGSLKGLGLSNRIINVLNKVNINFTWDLMQYPSPNLIKIEGLGPKSVEEINNRLNLFYEPPTD